MRSTETPTVYTLSLEPSRIHVQTGDGLLDFRSPLLGREPTPSDPREHDHVYGVVSPLHIVELSFHAGRSTGRSDLWLDASGRTFVERHTDAKGNKVTVVFDRSGP